MAADSCISSSRYTYKHDDHKGPIEAIDAHHVFVRKTRGNIFLVYFSKSVYFSSLLLMTTGIFLFLLKDKSASLFLWSLLSAVLVKLFLRKSVEKESIIIMPAFGIQLETHYSSGKIIHNFITIDKILKPVLTECVTPVTCYWSLSLVVREKEELVLVFKELRPPVKMLIPIWKALCDATNSAETLAPSG